VGVVLIFVLPYGIVSYAIGISVILIGSLIFGILLWVFRSRISKAVGHVDLNIRGRTRSIEENRMTSNRSRDLRRSTLDNSVKPLKNKVIRISQFHFKETETDKICMICKLPIQYRQVIYQCPNCKTLFHSNHLVGWLNHSDNCPICNHILSS